MSFLLHLSERINPFQSIIILSAAVLILSFFAVSKSKAVKKFLIVLVSISLIIAFYLNIYSYLSMGSFSSFLIFFGNIQMIEIGIILFSAISVLYFISVYHVDDENFSKILIIFLFSVICGASVILSKNFILMFISISVFVLSIFQLISATNSGVDKISLHIFEFFLRPVLAIILFFFGFSLLYGVTDFKDFNQILQSEYMSNALVVLALIIFGIALYLYFFLFPFQGPYMRMIKKSNFSTASVIWFLYFPVGVFTLINTGSLFLFFIERNNTFLPVLLIIITYFCMLAANIGAVKTGSVRRIMSFLFLFFMSIFLLNISMYSTGIIDRGSMDLFNLVNIFIILFSFMPLCSLFNNIEKNTGKDNINNITGLGRINIYAGINIIVIFLSWFGFLFYIEPVRAYLDRVDFLKMGAASSMVLAAMVTGFVFFSINIFRILWKIFKKPSGEEAGKVLFTWSLYAYITFFSVITLLSIATILLGILDTGIGFPDFEITGFNF
jgi:NADH:ubiquinone oxidoreductase subunit 2 (subunit N)